ncbi:hypothetical protein LTR17_027459 [Elasticomyces elasticus]|nr:hypothetical protein LTR17_027459 [Elasticomyces elasticus]
MQGSQAAGEKARMWTKLTGRYQRKIDHQRMKKKEKEDAAAAAATQGLTEPESELTPEQQIPPSKESVSVRRQKKASFFKFKTDIVPRFALEKMYTVSTLTLYVPGHFSLSITYPARHSVPDF